MSPVSIISDSRVLSRSTLKRSRAPPRLQLRCRAPRANWSSLSKSLRLYWVLRRRRSSSWPATSLRRRSNTPASALVPWADSWFRSVMRRLSLCSVTMCSRGSAEYSAAMASDASTRPAVAKIHCGTPTPVFIRTLLPDRDSQPSLGHPCWPGGDHPLVNRCSGHNDDVAGPQYDVGFKIPPALDPIVAERNGFLTPVAMSTQNDNAALGGKGIEPAGNGQGLHDIRGADDGMFSRPVDLAQDQDAIAVDGLQRNGDRGPVLEVVRQALAQLSCHLRRSLAPCTQLPGQRHADVAIGPHQGLPAEALFIPDEDVQHIAGIELIAGFCGITGLSTQRRHQDGPQQKMKNWSFRQHHCS